MSTGQRKYPKPIVARQEEIVENTLNSDSFIGNHPAVALIDGVTNNARFEFRVPRDFRELASAYIVVVPGGTGNMNRSASTDFGKSGVGESHDAHSGSIASGFVSVTINELERIDVSGALVNIVAEDEVGLTFTRAGGVAGDTIGATVYVLKLVIWYVIQYPR